ncbi:hypothetical protein BRARA_C00659 [Brassica rapa]|uniref:Gibberellin-regulated protein 4 n=2 Tax=Brassica campestris TaxID=3711 RepID=A0A397ZU55_BRACM|nr:gibberellin-regulated protein 4 [Brassica rapa]XP_013728179.1 gibberellin-regulated protein 4 [Brassica napus]KAG5403235.1 hypothetical protein IGI04_009354 [Brassica rapa subsp. trilocularis]RID68508.1 hypothetical protein BRARA_C00659 [Brassica rapa]CAG7879352.1 unnamed protein product [Brassica rapa]VDC78809.1 unnamed protein product [Brassica rapa]
MAKSYGALFLLALIVFSLLQTMVMASSGSRVKYNPKRYGPGSLKRSQCPKECDRRCSQTQYHNACILFCNKCCRKCLCVPPGYYGNKQVCSCYNNWKTQEGGPKCP